MAANHILVLKRNYKKVTSGSPFMVITFIKQHLEKSDYPSYEVVFGNTPNSVSVEEYIRAHKDLW
jgi:hypothetical protein